MKKLRILFGIVAAILATSFVLVACTPKPVDTKIDFGITPLTDLTDYAQGSQYYSPSPLLYVAETSTYNGTSAAAQVDQLKKQIEKEKKLFDEKDPEQSTFQKILAFATPDGVLEAMAYAALPIPQMQGLVKYIADNDEENFFKQYKEMEDQDKIMSENPLSTQAYEDAYKKQQRLRRGIFTRLNDTIGLKGDQAARTIIQASAYADSVVNDAMIAGQSLNVNQDQYFKALEKDGGLFDYDTLVFLKTNARIRGSVNANRQSAADAKLVGAYGYSYDYQSASYKALSKVDFESELQYNYTLQKDGYFESNNDALEYARIKRENYAKGYRYSDTFYKKYYQALYELEKVQAEVENEVYDINGSQGALTVQGVENATETVITVKVAKTDNVQSSVELKSTSLKNGVKADLFAGDAEYYYNGIADNVIDMATKQRAFEKKRETGAAKVGIATEQFNLEMANLKMTEFTVSQYIAKDYTGGLTESLKGQIYGVAADQSGTLNTFKKDLVLMIAELENYTDKTSAEYQNAVIAIGRKNARMDQYEKVAQQSSTTIDAKVGQANKVAWDKIQTELKAAIDFDYSKTAETNVDKTPRLNQLHYLLMKQNWKSKRDGTLIPYIPGTAGGDVNNESDYTIEYDTNHNISLLLYNQEDVLYHTAGMIRVRFMGAIKLNPEATGNNRYGLAIEYSSDKKAAYATETVSSGEKLDNKKNDQFPLPAGNDTAAIRGTVDSKYAFKGWYLDKAGYYKIDYDEVVEYSDITYYAVFG